MYVLYRKKLYLLNFDLFFSCSINGRQISHPRPYCSCRVCPFSTRLPTAVTSRLKVPENISKKLAQNEELKKLKTDAISKKVQVCSRNCSIYDSPRRRIRNQESN